mgnify:CR=1 FL=1
MLSWEAAKLSPAGPPPASTYTYTHTTPAASRNRKRREQRSGALAQRVGFEPT